MLPVHPLAEIFPLLEGKDFDDLVKSIKDRGFWGHIWTLDGQVLDGRNRDRACEAAGVKPVYKEWDGEGGDPASFVLAANLDRRHLTIGQRAIAVARAMQWAREEAAARKAAAQAGPGEKVGSPKVSAHVRGPSEAPRKAAADAAKAARVSTRTVENAAKVVAKGTAELQAAVGSGKVAVRRAADLADLPAEEQLAAIEDAAKGRPKAPADREKLLKQLKCQHRKVKKLIVALGWGPDEADREFRVVWAEGPPRKAKKPATAAAG